MIELREWSRMNDDLQHERNRLTNRLREQIRRYFPQALQLGDDPGADWFLAVLEVVPTPTAAKVATPEAVAEVLQKHRIRRVDGPAALALLREKSVSVAPGTVEAATAHIGLLRPRLRLLNSQLKETARRLEDLCGRLTPPEGSSESSPGEKREQRDVDILRSLPGIGRIVLATLLAEASQPLRNRDYPAIRSLGGTAPVTRRSGKRILVVMRHACQPRIRRALYHWARVAAQCDDVWRARYRDLRARGHSHGRACRGIADRLLEVAIAMLRTGTLYDPCRLHAKPAEKTAQAKRA